MVSFQFIVESTSTSTLPLLQSKDDQDILKSRSAHDFSKKENKYHVIYIQDGDDLSKDHVQNFTSKSENNDFSVTKSILFKLFQSIVKKEFLNYDNFILDIENHLVSYRQIITESSECTWSLKTIHNLFQLRSSISDSKNLKSKGKKINHPYYVSIRSLNGGIKGGKGGFGALLRAQGRSAHVNKTTDFGACRDLQGRRLRHVNDEIKLRKWKDAKDLDEQAKRDGIILKKTHVQRMLEEKGEESNLQNWYLAIPSWIDSSSIKNFDKKTSSKRNKSYKSKICKDWELARGIGIEKLTPDEKKKFLDSRKRKGKQGKKQIDGEVPHNAPRWWGCPRGRACRFAHGIEELSGEAAELYQAEERERQKQKR